jgi:hypothetical protein
MKNALFGLLMFILVFEAKAQIPQVYGNIASSETGEFIEGAIISDTTGSYYTYTNRNGYYSLGVGGGKYILLVTAEGYKSQRFEMFIYGAKELSIALEPLDPMESDTTSNIAVAIHEYRSGCTAPLIQQVQTMPSLLCEPDPVKLLQYLPGVTGGIEGLSGLYARGGNSDQNLNLMDGLPLYGNGHIFGFLSGFNPDQIRNFQFYRGATPARYGGRAGAVLDVSMLEGNKNQWKGSYWADLLAMKLSMDGPISKRTTATIGIRRSYVDLFLPHQGEDYIYYNIYDINAKTTTIFNEKNKMSVWVYNGRDKYAFKFTSTSRDSSNRLVSEKQEDVTMWQNTLAGINLAHKISHQLYSVFTLGISRFAYTDKFNFERTISKDTSVDWIKATLKETNSITDIIGKADFEYNLITGDYLRFGAEIINHGFSPTTQDFKVNSAKSGEQDSVFGKVNKQGALETSVYGEYEASLNTGLKLNIGARLWMFAAKEKTYFFPEPRIMLSQMLAGQKAIKFGFSITNQGINQLASVNASIPGNIWFPATKMFKPQQNIQFTAGYYKPLKQGFELTLDVYYKILKGVTDVTNNDEGDYKRNYWEQILVQGSGKAYGLEAMVLKKHGKLNGMVSYAWSLSNRTLPEINFGRTYPFRWDRRNKFSLTGVYHVNSAFFLNFGLVIMTGNWVSVPTSKYVAADGTFIYDYSEKNNFKMPYYSRVDIGFSKQIHPFVLTLTKQYWGINVYNTLNHFNPLFIDLRVIKQKGIQAIGTSYFPLVPTIFYKWTF